MWEEFYPLFICFDGERPDANTVPWGYVKDNPAELKVDFRYNSTPENNEITQFLKILVPNKYLYDFNNPDNEDAIFTSMSGEFKKGVLISEGVEYPGFLAQRDAYVQGLGYVPLLNEGEEDNDESGRTLVGLHDMLAAISSHDPLLKVYEIADRNGKVLFQVPSNRPQTGLTSVTGNALRVKAEGSNVVVKAEAGMEVEVVSMQGAVVWRGSTDSNGRARTEALTPGVYVVKCGLGTAKVVIKQGIKQ